MSIADLSLLEIFLKVHQNSSFSKAAVHFGVTPSVISKKISLLESTLRVSLFKRTTRRIQLTEEGQRLVESAERILSEIKKIEGEFDRTQTPEELTGTLRISSPETYANARLVKLVSRFSNLHPKLKIDLVLTNSFLNLTDENIDIAFRVFKPTDSSLKSFKFQENELVFCASPSFIKKHGKIRSIRHLQNHQVLFLPSHSSEKFRKSGLSIGRTFPDKQITVNSGETINQFCINGFCVALRSLWDVQRYIQEKKLIQLDIDDCVDSSSAVYVVFSGANYLPRRTRAFIDFLKESEKRNIF